MKNNNYICDMPYLRNSIEYDHDFTRCFLFYFIFFLIFFFFGLLGGWGGGKGQKMVQDDKTICLLQLIS